MQYDVLAYFAAECKEGRGASISDRIDLSPVDDIHTKDSSVIHLGALDDGEAKIIYPNNLLSACDFLG